jgi:hypothetical protein
MPSLSDDVAQYVNFGIHRVGSTGEKKTAIWLRKRIAALGYRSRIDKFAVPTVLNPAGAIFVGGQEISAFPQWNTPHNALGISISAPLKILQDAGDQPFICVTPKALNFAPNWNASHDKLVADAAAKGARALIMAIDIASAELFVCNQHSQKPLPIPVAMVQSAICRHWWQRRNKLHQFVAAAGQDASLRFAGQPMQANALNVVGEKSGTGQRIVISTPLTGWFHCGGERGPGIALWLRMARYLAKSKRPVTLLGTGSHEVSHLGMEHALANGAPPPEDVALWLHFGASLGATAQDAQYGFKSPQYLVGLDATEQLAKSKLLSIMPIYVSGDNKTQGEAGQVIGAGYKKFIGMSGMFPTFHTPKDIGRAIDYAKLELIAAASEALLAQVSI